MSFEDSVAKQFAGDYALTSQNGFTPTDVSSAAAVRKLPQATAVVGVRAGKGKAFGKQAQVTGVDPGGSQVLRLSWQEGSQASLDHIGAGGALVDADYAKKHHLDVGSPLHLLTPYRQSIDLHVTGWVLMASGLAVLGLTIWFWQTRRRRHALTLVEQTQLGALEMVIGSSEFASVVPEFAVFDLPFLFKDRAEFQRQLRARTEGAVVRQSLWQEPPTNE